MTEDVIERPDPQQPIGGSPPQDIPDGGITSDPTIAAEEGEAYHFPVDPPVVGVQDDGDPRIAAGFGADAQADPYDDDHRSGLGSFGDEMSGRVREALLADSLGSSYADRLGIRTAGSVVWLDGVVDDLDVMDHLVGVVGALPGVSEVRDRLTLPGPSSGAGRDVRAEDR
jgi:hypothetical protein